MIDFLLIYAFIAMAGCIWIIWDRIIPDLREYGILKTPRNKQWIKIKKVYRALKY
jgi:hypothetical protein